MPVATVEQLRKVPILVTIPGTDLQIECRRPDPLELFARNLIPLETYASVLDSVRTQSFLADAQKEPQVYEAFIDRWVCAAAVNPRIVLTQEEIEDDALWIEELPPGTVGAIFSRTNDRLRAPRVSAAVQEFRELCALRARTGSHSASLSLSTEPVVINA